MKRGVRRDSNTSPRLTHSRVHDAYTTDTISSPGWTRTTDLLHVRELSWPLDHGTVFESTSPRSRTRTPTFEASRAVRYTSEANSGRCGTRTHKANSPARLAPEVLIQPDTFLSQPAAGSRQQAVDSGLHCLPPAARCRLLSGRGGSRTHKRQALDLTAMPVRVLDRQWPRGESNSHARWARRSEHRVSTSFTTWPSSMGEVGVEPTLRPRRSRFTGGRRSTSTSHPQRPMRDLNPRPSP